MKNIPESLETARLAVSNLEDCCWQIVGEIKNAFGVHSTNWGDAYAPDEKTLPAAMQSLAISLDAIASVCEQAANGMARVGLAMPSLPRPEPLAEAQAEKKPLEVILDPPGEDGMVSARFDEATGEWVPDFVDGGHAVSDTEDDREEEDASWRTSDFAEDIDPTPDTPIGTGTITFGGTTPAEPEPATLPVTIPENPEKTGARPRSRRSGGKKAKKKSH